jgi:hypothetical protein
MTDTQPTNDASIHLYMAELFAQLGNDFAALGNQLDRLESAVAKIADRVLALENYARAREMKDRNE